MVIYYKEDQFPNAKEKCFINPRRALLTPVEYMPGDRNVVVVKTDDDLDAFEVFWENMDDFITYIIDGIKSNYGEMYLQFLEEQEGEDLSQKLFLEHFEVEGVEGFPG